MKDILLVTVECLRWDYRDVVDAFEGLDVSRCQTAGHYTRPALAGLLGGSVADALARAPRSPTLPGVLEDAGYQTVGVCHSPQTTADLGFDVFDDYYNGTPAGDGALARGSKLRERLGSHAVVRRVKRRLTSKASTLANVQRDDATVDQAANAAWNPTQPTFCWLHLMGSHRPYGWAAGALPSDIGTKAASAGPSRLAPTLSDREAQRVREHYERAVRRVSDHIADVLTAVADDETVVAILGDHGEELGEDGYWFHGPYRRRVVSTLTDVPLATRNLTKIPESAAALPAALAQGVGVDAPESWHRPDDLPVTVAPWDGKASARIGRNVTLRNGSFDATARDASQSVQEQLEALGYV